MIITEITNQDNWYPKLYQECFTKEDVWFENLANPKYKAYHIEQKAFLIIHTVDDKEIEIITIGVASQFRRNGFAKILLNSIIENATKNTKIFLEVSTDNTPAINLYKVLGFQKIALRKNYYENSDATIMCLTKI